MNLMLVYGAEGISTEEAEAIRQTFLIAWSNWKEGIRPYRIESSEGLCTRFVPEIHLELPRRVLVCVFISRGDIDPEIYLNENGLANDICFAVKSILQTRSVDCLVTFKDKFGSASIG